MVRTLHLPPSDPDRYGPDFRDGIDLEGAHAGPARPVRRWLFVAVLVIVAAVVLAATIVAIVTLFAMSTTGSTEGADDRGIVQTQQTDVEGAHDSGIDLWLREP